MLDIMKGLEAMIRRNWRPLILIVLFSFFSLVASIQGRAAESDVEAMAPEICQQADLKKQNDILLAAASFSKKCIKRIIDESGKDAFQIALLSGWPSLLVDRMSDNEFLSILESSEYYGDRWLFVKDVDLINSLALINLRTDLQHSEKVNLIHDFTLGSLLQSVTEEPVDGRRYATVANVGKIGVEVIKAYCSRPDCRLPEGQSACSERFAPELKISYIRDRQAVLSKLSACAPEPSYVAFLRRLGILEGNCSFSTQLNLMSRRGIGPETDCETLLLTLPTEALSSEDVVQHIRLVLTNDAALRMTPDQRAHNQRILDSFSPGLAREVYGSTGVPR